MTLEIKRTISCDKCHMLFDATFYKSINVTLNPELKEKVMDGSIYSFKCPFCGQEHNISYPFLYHDMQRKFMIKMSSLSGLMEYYNDVVKPGNKNPNDMVPEDTLQLGVTSYKELLSKIVMLENGFDYRIATIYCLIVKAMYNEKIMETPVYVKARAKACGSYFSLKNGKLVTITYIGTVDGEEELEENIDEIEMRVYHMLEEDYAGIIKEIFSYCFNDEVALKVLCEKEKGYDNLRNSEVEIASVETDDNPDGFALVPKFNEGKYKSGDIVCIMKNRNIKKATIRRIYKMNKLFSPVDAEDIPAVAYKVNKTQLKHVPSPENKLDNKALMEMLIAYKKSKKMDDKLLSDSNVLTGFYIMMSKPDLVNNDDADEIMINLSNKTQFMSDLFNMQFMTYWSKEENAMFLCVYTDQKELNAKGASKMIFKFDDIANLLLNNPDKYDGIVINPESEKIIISTTELVKHKYNRIMTDQDEMVKLLSKLKEEEIDYMGKFSYEVICKVYNENKGPDKLAKELHKTKEEIGDALNQGYKALQHIIMDNYE